MVRTRASRAAASAAMSRLASVDPSSTTISSSSAWVWARMEPMASSSHSAPFHTGMTTEIKAPMSGFAPEDGGAVDPPQRRLYAPPGAKGVDRVAAAGEIAVIVDDDEAARRDLVVEQIEAIDRRAVEIDVDPEDGQLVDR